MKQTGPPEEDEENISSGSDTGTESDEDEDTVSPTLCDFDHHFFSRD
jgi:hypothetical protein